MAVRVFCPQRVLGDQDALHIRRSLTHRQHINVSGELLYRIFVGQSIARKDFRRRRRRVLGRVNGGVFGACLAALTAAYLARAVARVEGSPWSISQPVRWTSSRAYTSRS